MFWRVGGHRVAQLPDLALGYVKGGVGVVPVGDRSRGVDGQVLGSSQVQE